MRWFIARHGETIFNAAGRMQGDAVHTPLTRAGFAQAERCGAALAEELRREGRDPKRLDLWSSPAGRCLQTMAILAEAAGLDRNDVRTDARLREMEMGDWGGRLYADIAAESGAFVDRSRGLFTRRAPGGEWYDEVAARLRAWLADAEGGEADRVIVMHGLSSRVLRGILTGAPEEPLCRAPVARPLPQGTLVCIDNGQERVLALGTSGFGASVPA